MATAEKREVPCNTEAEEFLLGALLSDESVILDIVDLVQPDDFYNEINKRIFSAILELFSGGGTVDLITVAEQLKKRGDFETVGGYAFLTDLTDGSFLTANADQYAKIVAEKAQMRSLIKAGQEIAETAYNGKMDAADVMETAEKLIFDVSQGRSRRSYSAIDEVLAVVYNELEASVGKDGITGIPTGFLDLDRKLSGLRNSDLILVAARPGMGKTAFMLDIAQYVAVNKKIPVAFFNLEMAKEQLVTRILSSASGVPNEKLRSGELADSDWSDLAEAAGFLAGAPLYIDDALDVSISSIRAKCRKLKLEKDIRLVIIDYLQLMTAGTRRSDGNRVQEVSDISRGLKMLAREINVPVIVGSQLSRSVETRPDKRPILSDLRESGAIEQDADIVMFLYRDAYYNKENMEFKDVAEVLIEKHRNGALGKIKLIFDGEHTKFRSMTTQRPS